MDNRNLLKGIIILLVVSVFMNMMTYKKAQNLEQRVQALSNQDSRIEQIVNSTLSQMHNTLNQMKEQGNWISPISLDVGKDVKGSTTLILSWQIKEYPVGAPVTLYYQLDSTQAFTPITAISTGGGNFTAELQVPKVFRDPEWCISYSGESNIQNDLSTKNVRAVKEKEEALSNSQLIGYVTMQNGSKVLTSEKTIQNTSKINQMAGTLDVNVQFRGRERMIMMREIDDMAEIKIKSARLKVKESPTVKTEIPFTKRKDPNEPISLYEASYTAPANTSPELTVRILYDNGEVVEKKL